MYLKTLSAFGFKSFAEKTTLAFQPGLTAIVGPNGCGKSNIADAIRWVLGEQSAKALRGGEMTDVIFNGTDNRKPLGLAEVSLTLGGVDEEHLKAAGVELAYEEVTVTRRVFRNAGSEYFINKTPCRLKDIQQLFAGTGMGRASYSIMAQGNITQILSSRPEDRRLVFEEAAGITRFKAQKREALRKLEGTEQNLLRVADLIREVKRQIISLQRQAGKARRYKLYMAELQHLDTQLARHQYDVSQREIEEGRERIEALRGEIEACSGEVVRGEDEVSQLRERLAELEHAISSSQQRGLELKAETDRHENRIQYNEERLGELAARNEKALADIAEAEERKLAAERALAETVERLESAEAKLGDARRQLEARREALKGLEDEVRLEQEAMRQAQSDVFDAAQQLTRVRNEINALDLQKQGNVIRIEKLSAEKIQLEEERARLAQRLEEFARESEAEQAALQTRRSSCQERQERLRTVQREIGQAGLELDQLQRRQAEIHSRLNVLQQLESSREGFGAGALAALKDTQQVLGSLADRIRVPDEYVPAIEAALGSQLQIVLTHPPDAARQILADLSAHQKGRASIASLDLATARRQAPRDPSNASVAPEASPETPAWPGPEDPLETLGCVAALGVVEGDAAVLPLVESLLGRTQVAPDLEAATAAWRACGGRFDFVTRAGDLLNRHGVFTGGSSNSSSKGPSSILGRKNQIAELERSLAEIHDRVNDASRRKGTLLSEQTALQASLQQEQSELQAQEVAIATRQGEFKALQNAQRVLEQKVDTVVFEIQTLAGQEREGSERRASLSAQVGELETRDDEAQRRLTELTGGLEDLRARRDQLNAAVTEAKVAVATEEQLGASFRQQQGPLEQRIRELAHLVEQRRQEIAQVLDRRGQAQMEIEDSRGRIGAVQHERDQLGLRTADLLAQRDAQAGAIATREEALRNSRRRLTEQQELRSAAEVGLAQKEMALRNIVERIQQRYQINLADVRSECITITYAAEGPARVETLTPEQMAAAGVSTDWNAVADQVAALQAKIDEMGPVNLVAIEEYEETEQRHQFLSSQHDDLVKAKEQLIEVINRVNTQTRQMFTETFHNIRDNFRSIFVEIFGGGAADLNLVDEGDVLESGIEIMARPPGKQLRSISLLSGGEQTMTAVALLFAIYQVRPSPFCVLDELDAPLDESNINRFIRVLQRFLAHSQFIVITHNKRTIGMADVLYGITMQEQGVSKIVSVKFHKTDTPMTDRAAASIETPINGPSIGIDEDRESGREETLELTVAE